MFAVSKILHPTDFSTQAERAFQAACDMAHKYSAELVLLHVIPPVVVYGEMDTDLFHDRITRKQIDAQLNAMTSQDPHMRIKRLVVEGDAAHEIIAAAKEKGCDLIVLGSHGRRGISRLLLGSVAQDVLRKSPCPVLVTNRGTTEDVVESGDGFAEVPASNVVVTTFLNDLLQILKIQAGDTQRLVEHVEQHTGRLLEPSQMSLVASELAVLQARLDGVLAVTT